VLQKETTV